MAVFEDEATGQLQRPLPGSGKVSLRNWWNVPSNPAYTPDSRAFQHMRHPVFMKPSTRNTILKGTATSHTSSFVRHFFEIMPAALMPFHGFPTRCGQKCFRITLHLIWKRCARWRNLIRQGIRESKNPTEQVA
jgi:hypothetical protein